MFKKLLAFTGLKYEIKIEKWGKYYCLPQIFYLFFLYIFQCYFNIFRTISIPFWYVNRLKNWWSFSVSFFCISYFIFSLFFIFKIQFFSFHKTSPFENFVI